MLEAVFFEIFLKELCKKKKFRGMISFVNFLWLLKQMFVFVLGFFWSFTDKISGSGERERLFVRNIVRSSSVCEFFKKSQHKNKQRVYKP